MSPADARKQAVEAVMTLLFLGTEFTRDDGATALRDAGFIVGIAALLRRGFIYQSMDTCRITARGKEALL
jgi:hypothetical protein